jgi:nitric oxide reductase NorE protein
VFVLADMTIFGVLFGCFMVDRHRAPELFEASRRALNRDLGGVNTLILLTGSWLVVLAITALRNGRNRLSSTFFALAFTCGLAFTVSKTVEYTQKINAGVTLLTNDFYMYYFILTGIHLIHVIAGSVVLGVLWFKSRSARSGGGSLTVYESGATFWHMVDLLWVFLFPLLYLLR